MKQHLKYIGLDVHKERNEIVLLPDVFLAGTIPPDAYRNLSDECLAART
jgi:hypothetical protein